MCCYDKHSERRALPGDQQHSAALTGTPVAGARRSRTHCHTAAVPRAGGDQPAPSFGGSVVNRIRPQRPPRTPGECRSGCCCYCCGCCCSCCSQLAGGDQPCGEGGCPSPPAHWWARGIASVRYPGFPEAKHGYGSVDRAQVEVALLDEVCRTKRV